MSMSRVLTLALLPSNVHASARLTCGLRPAPAECRRACDLDLGMFQNGELVGVQGGSLCVRC
jgi:hypothetical protein